ncbi:hypothetical protein PROFUN_02770 [Planoprotostelium fungivorum]|uniref:Uncharacterized protein n=1 Tax=Planoprotostelium fungivorum TaxID=1890364 RepID=A0A2P6NXJ1_9EUKA|nr:hypothetical protein PROFUN_02770 [Planoprotostelium fungivorum]
MKVILLIVLFFAAVQGNWEDLVVKLVDRVQQSQVQIEQSYAPPEWHEQKGIFPSQIKINFFGNPAEKLLREYFSIFDNNMFVTVWLLEVLINAQEINPQLIHLNETVIQDGLDLLERFRDKNINSGVVDGAPIYVFWSQIDKNGTWSASPDNLNRFITSGEDVLDRIGEILKGVWLPSWGQELEDIASGLKMLSTAFLIPPDLDDSGCNLSLGSSLSRLPLYRKNFKSWLRYNSDVKQLSERIVKYAYRPHSNDTNECSIDPRTYFFLHEYLYSRGGDDLALMTTWVMNLEESRKSAPLGVAMPEYINNVDASVSCNIIAGLLRHLVYNTVDDSSWFTPELQNILNDTSDYIRWVVESGRIVERPDIGMLYYPSLYNFYWFASRVVFTLTQPETIALHERFPILKEMTLIWTETVRVHMLDLLRSQKIEDVTINSLLDAWTVSQPNTSACSLRWIEDTPDDVRIMTERSIDWIEYAITSNSFSLGNAFFSGSIKGYPSIPNYFPANRFEFLNGTVFDHPVEGVEIYSVRGIIAEEEYEKMIQEMSSPNFEGFNATPFPYWSSEPLTLASALAAVSKYIALSRC